MNVDTRIAFERRQPSKDLRAFLDPLKPGDYFDCGGARLYGIDEALEAEARRRGRAVGEDQFQLVATDGGLIFCRASIMFAIAARWKDLTIGRPEERAEGGDVQLPISWPTHGDLQFTVSRRLGSNIFRRWLQLQAQATRRSQVEQDVRFERSNGPEGTAANGHAHPDTIDLRGDNGNGSKPSVSPPIDDSDRDMRDEVTPREQRRRGLSGAGHTEPGVEDRSPTSSPDPLATIDAAVVDEWVDDRVPHTSEQKAAGSINPRPSDRPTSPRVGPVGSALFDEAATADPFNGYDLHAEAGDDRGRSHRSPVNGNGANGANGNGATGNGATGNGANGNGANDGAGAVRFDLRSAPPEPESWAEVDDRDANATRFMRRTIDGTDIFPDGDTGRRSSGATRRRRQVDVPVPEISGARLQHADTTESDGPRLDIRSTLLAGRRESEWVEIIRRRQVLILCVVTILALGLIALIGFLSGGDDSSETIADNAAVADSGAVAAPDIDGSGDAGSTPDQEAVGSPTTVAATAGAAAEGATIDSTAPTLRVSSTSVQICHSNYGGCVPVAADVDCEGDGDGPAFQATPVAVFGDDVYELDTDDDREACEADQPRLDVAGGDG